MSVAVPIIDFIDGASRRIYLKSGVSDFYPIEDIYHEYRNRRRLDTDELRKYNPLLKAEGNVPKGAGAFTPRYVVLLEGTKIIPFDESLQINQLGDMITDDPNTDPTLYDISGLTTAKPIFIKPSEAETIQLNSASIEFSTYNNGVTIDQNNITGKASAGTKHPIGTRQVPSNNLQDTLAIANKIGVTKVYVIGNLDINLGANFSRFEFEGETSTKTLITIDPSANVLNCEFYSCTLSGTLDGNTQIEKGVVTNLDFVDGYIDNCALNGTIILGTSTLANIFSCKSGVPGVNTPVIDMNGTGILGLRDYYGGIRLENYSGNNFHSIDLSSGQVILDPNTITGGTFIFRGIGKLTNGDDGTPIKTGLWNSTVNVVNELLNTVTISEAAVYSEAVYVDTVLGRAGTTEPIGLERDPSNNLADAKIIAEVRGTTKIIFKSDFTFASSDVLFGYDLYGTGWQNQKVTFTSGCILAYCALHDLTVTGNLTGITGISDCFVDGLGSVGIIPSSQDLVIRRSKIGGTITLPSNYSGQITMVGCYANSDVNGHPTFDAGNFEGSFLMDDWSGEARIENITKNNDIHIRMARGEIKLAPTVTSALICIMGIGKLIDVNREEIPTGTWNGNVRIENDLINNRVVATGGTFSTEEKDKLLADSTVIKDLAEIAAAHAIEKLNQ